MRSSIEPMKRNAGSLVGGAGHEIHYEYQCHKILGTRGPHFHYDFGDPQHNSLCMVDIQRFSGWHEFLAHDGINITHLNAGG